MSLVALRKLRDTVSPRGAFVQGKACRKRP
jgi:hypothetical protein